MFYPVTPQVSFLQEGRVMTDLNETMTILPGCQCGDDCKATCAQRFGTAPACEPCGCTPFLDDFTAPLFTERDVLDAARAIVKGQRQEDYGDASRNLTRVGAVWGALLGTSAINPRTVAVMLAALKLVRAAGRANRDDLIDGAGYILLADEAED